MTDGQPPQTQQPDGRTTPVVETRRTATLLRAAAVLWAIWGLAHMFAGVATIVQDTTSAVQALADAVEPATLEGDYPDAVGGILNQHGFNLFWTGTVATLCSWFIWKRSRVAVFLAAIVGGLTDIGFFVFVDLPGYAGFMPGTLMTIISATAVIAGFLAINVGRGQSIQEQPMIDSAVS